MRVAVTGGAGDIGLTSVASLDLADVSRPLRIVAYSDATVRGGAEQTLGTLLAHLDPAHEVTVLGVDETVVDWIAERRPGAGTRLVPEVRNKFDLPAIAAHVRAVRDLRPDVLHANLQTPWEGQFGQLAGLVFRPARVVVFENSPVRSTSKAQLFTKRLLSRSIDAHVACGGWLAREIEANAGLPAGRIRVIHNGIPETLPDVVDELPSGLVVGTVGRLAAEKGFDVLVRAIATVPDVQLVIVGSGPEASSLASLASELGVDDRVTLTGWVEDSRAWLVGFDVFVLPSLMEGFPLTTLEAMLAAIPVVASDVGGVGEAVLHEETGLLVPPSDVDELARAIRRLAGNEDERERFGRRGQEIVTQRFTARVMAQQFEALYRELVRG
ncbi:MAG TPA: glycosyltransferase family 4 protein [Acidimicrobiales bacterium]|nr:glycosyltransferase family 4 protein [Acidimicrobiales bacterium]